MQDLSNSKPIKSNSRLDSFKHACHGLVVLSQQTNARIEMACGLLIVSLGWFFQISEIEWALILLSIGFVLSLESLNTALELCVDLADPKWSLLAKKAKDTAAAGVLISCISVFCIGILIFAPKLKNCF